jgi:DNA-binding CsgD family transcriptional regulator
MDDKAQRTSGRTGSVRLSGRQREVLVQVAMGRSAREIADALGITPRTVRAHTDALRFKLGARRARDLPLAYRVATGRDPLTGAPAPLSGVPPLAAAGRTLAVAGI